MNQPKFYPIEPPKDPCLTCNGTGQINIAVAADVRASVTCYSCNGSGQFSDALARGLSGEALPISDKAFDDLKHALKARYNSF